MTKLICSDRQRRYKIFQKFLDSAADRFNDLCAHHDTASYLSNIYSFHVSPGGRIGGMNARQLDVFFGARPYDEQKVIGNDFRANVKLLAERGASLEFTRDDHGRVHVLLSPAFTEGTRPLEDAILLGVISNPRDLLKEAVISHYFKLLVAYMQCTCLDGKPTLVERLKVVKIRYFQRAFVQSKLCVSRFWMTIRTVLRWGATVGFSGVLLAFIQWGFASNGPMAVKVVDEPAQAQQQRSDLIKLEQENGLRLETVERSIAELQHRLDAPLLVIPLKQLEKPSSGNKD